MKKRVEDGGHNIPPDTIERRYKKGILNLPVFISLSEEWLIFDNSAGEYTIVSKAKSIKESFTDSIIAGLIATKNKLIEKEKKRMVTSS